MSDPVRDPFDEPTSAPRFLPEEEDPTVLISAGPPLVVAYPQSGWVGRLTSLFRPTGLDLLKADLGSAVWRLAWPVVVTMVLQSSFALLDMAWIGRFGEDSLAAVSAASFWMWMVFAVGNIGAFGLTALVARTVGAEDYARTGRVVHAGLRWGWLSSLAIGLLGLAFLPQLFVVMGVDAHVAALGGQFLSIILVGTPISFTLVGLTAILRGSGNTVAPMGVYLLTGGTLAILDPLLIYGVGPIPAMGVVGAAIATVLSQVLGVIVLVRLHLRGDLHMFWTVRPLREFDWDELWRIVRIGLPPATSGVLFSVVYIVLARTVSTFGTAGVAAIGLGHKIESLNFLTASGFAVAASTMVGQSLGAGSPERAERSTWIAVRYIAAITLTLTVPMVLIPETLCRVFTHDAGVVEACSSYLRIVGFSQLFMGVEVVLAGAFAGAGDTLPPALVSVPMSFMRIPLAAMLALPSGLEWGLPGVWAAISVTTIVKGIILAIWFRTNRWKHRAV